jgi:hypothetical protein
MLLRKLSILLQKLSCFDPSNKCQLNIFQEGGKAAKEEAFQLLKAKERKNRSMSLGF